MIVYQAFKIIIRDNRHGLHCDGESGESAYNIAYLAKYIVLS